MVEELKLQSDLHEYRTIHEQLRSGAAVAVCFANLGTRFDLVLVPTRSIVGVGSILGDSHRHGMVVALLNFRAAWSFPHAPSSVYLQEKLGLAHRGDADSVSALLSILMGDSEGLAGRYLRVQDKIEEDKLRAY